MDMATGIKINRKQRLVIAVKAIERINPATHMHVTVSAL